jgi:hypothetical protein
VRPSAAPCVIATAALATVLAQPGGAQISTDRPDFVEAASTVPAGHFQVETSVAFTRESDALDVWTTPTLFRIGLPRDLEARVESEWLVHLSPELGESDTGLGDVAIGVKWHARDGEPGTADPAVALLLHADLPTHSRESLGSPGVRPSLRAVGEWEPAEGLSLAVMSGAIHERDDHGGRFLGGIFGVVVAKQWSDAFRTFAESAWEQLASEEHGGNLGFWDVGATFLLTPDLQLDAALLIGANDASPDFGFTLGLSALSRW